jgi:PAS domain S-box-containing protein
MTVPLRVLILEDRPADALLMVHELRRAGFDPVWQRVETEEDYVAHLQAHLDVILADYSLPQFNAMEALQLLQARGGDTPFVIVSATIGEELAVSAMKQGAADYLLKDRLARLGPAVARALQEVSERRARQQAEAALRASEARFRLVAEAAPVLLWMAGEDMGCTYFNEGWLAFTGRTMAQELGFGWADSVHPDDAERCLTFYSTAFAAHQPFEMEYRLRRADGVYCWVLGRGVPLVTPEGHFTGYIGSAIDITLRKEAEQILQRAQADLERRVAERTAALAQQTQRLEHEMAERQRMQEALFQQEKLAALGTLLANVAHELNNPLAVAALQIDNLQEEGDSGSWTEDLELLQQAVERCKSVVQSFLALARQQPPTRQAVALHEAIDEVLVLLERAMEVDGITVENHLPDGLPPLWADPNQLQHVLANLITNAHYALRQTSSPRHLRLTATATADRSQVKLEVTDSGPGIPQDLQRRVFEPFFTTKPQGEGSGLGLPLCRSIVEAHGGTMHLTSQPGHCTTVAIILPAAVSAIQDPKISSEPVEPVQTQGKTILIIDDEPSMQRALGRLLKRRGHEVTMAASGLEALVALEACAYEIILCDMRMPDLDGAGFYRELERRHPHLVSRVIFLTGDVLSPEAAAFFAQIDNPRFEKPFEAQAVQRMIQQVLET